MNIKYSYKNYLNLTSNTIFGISLWRWLRLLAKNKFAVDVRFLPKIIFITGNIILNTPIQLYEFLRYNKRIKKASVVRPLFILGHPRSGTTYLLNVLSKDPALAFCATYEALTPLTFLTAGTFTQKMLELAMPATRPQDNVKTGARMPLEEEFAMGSISGTSLAHGYYFPKSLFNVFDESVIFEKDKVKNTKHWQKRFDYFLKKLTYKYKGKKLLLKSPANTGRMKEILELYPDACFIHIHRDPYSVYQSNINLYEKILPLLSFQKVESDFIEKFILYSYKKMNLKYLEDMAFVPTAQLIEISYTDFVSAPMEQLEKIYGHLKISDFNKAAPYFKIEIDGELNYKTNTYSTLDDKTKSIVADQWSFMFEHYGYIK